MVISDLWRGYLNEHPEDAYFGYQNQWKTPNQKKYFQSQFANIQNQYKGARGSQIYAGGAPSLEFTDFLGRFNWGQEFQGLTPQERGQDFSRYNPWTRWQV